MADFEERPEMIEKEAEFDAQRFVDELRKKGLKDEEIELAIEDSFKAGELTEEEYHKVKEYLEGEERMVASDLFGVEL